MKTKTMKTRTYMGVLITPAGINSSGIRWHAFGPNGQLRSDALTEMKQMIREQLRSARSPDGRV